MDYYVLLITFFFIATVYSSVGFGGGSSYLALLAVSGLEYHLIRSTALMCNIVVVAGGSYVFWKEGRFTIRQALPFVLTSVPLAYLGGRTPIKENTFFIVLGIALIFASVLLWIQPEKIRSGKTIRAPIIPYSIGGVLGYLSGLISIGGGIFLSPLLNLVRYADARTIAGLASFFILVNSASGLAGQLHQLYSPVSWAFIVPLLGAVLAGGQVGSRIGARRFNLLWMKRATAVLIFLASVFILHEHL